MFNFDSVRDAGTIVPSKRKEGLKFVGMKRNTEDSSVTFEFLDPITKDTLAHREFLPSRQDGQADDKFKVAVTMNVGRIAHIFRAFVSEEEFKAIKVEDPENLSKVKENWMTITSAVGKKLKEKMAEEGFDATCALKIVLRKVKDKYYSSLPMVPPFISTLNHHKDFTWNPAYDILEAPTFRPNTEGKAPEQGTGTSGSSTSTPKNDDPDF